jgi:hypothetical protein
MKLVEISGSVQFVSAETLITVCKAASLPGNKLLDLQVKSCPAVKCFANIHPDIWTRSIFG